MPAPERKLVINETAQRDYLDLLKQSVLSWGHDHAARYKGSLDATMERLLEFPELGRRIPVLLEGGRRIRSKHHVIYYTFTDYAVVIHRILHERRHVTQWMLMESED